MKKLWRGKGAKSTQVRRPSVSVSARGGFTMVEMIVSFALLGIFMVVACQIMASCARLYNQVKGMSYGRQVANTIMDKIAGEIEDAGKIPTPDPDNPNAPSLTIWKDTAGLFDKIDFYDRSSGHVFLTATAAYKGEENSWRIGQDEIKAKYAGMKSQLFMHYYEVTTVDPEDPQGAKKVTFEATNWLFDEAMYMNYTIKRLNFTLCPEEYNTVTGVVTTYPDTIIRIDLVIESPRYGEYTMKRYVDCITFREAELLCTMTQTWWGRDETETRYTSTNAVVSTDYWSNLASNPAAQGTQLRESGIFEADGSYYLVLAGGLSLTQQQYDDGPAAVEAGSAAGTLVKLTGTVYQDTLNDVTNLEIGDVFYDSSQKKTYVCRYSGYNLSPAEYPQGWKLIAE